RAACYWLEPGHVVYQEYERQRRAVAFDSAEKVKNVHTLAMKALEDMLKSTKRPDLRFQAMKLVYESHLKEDLNKPQIASSEELVHHELEQDVTVNPITM